MKVLKPDNSTQIKVASRRGPQEAQIVPSHHKRCHLSFSVIEFHERSKAILSKCNSTSPLAGWARKAPALFPGGVGNRPSYPNGGWLTQNSNVWRQQQHLLATDDNLIHGLIWGKFWILSTFHECMFIYLEKRGASSQCSQYKPLHFAHCFTLTEMFPGHVQM